MAAPDTLDTLASAAAAQGDSGVECAPPSATRLAVFLVGVVGLGKSTLARALCQWARGAENIAEGGACASAAAAELDQDSLLPAPPGCSGEAALLAALHCHLDAGARLLFIHRNGPGSAPLLEALRARGVPWVCVYPSQLLAAAPCARSLLGAARALLARGAEAPGLAALDGPQRVAVLRGFFTALPSAAAAIAPLAGAGALALRYFEERAAAPPPAPTPAPAAEAELVALRWLLTACGQAPFSQPAAGPEDAALAEAAGAEARGAAAAQGAAAAAAAGAPAGAGAQEGAAAARHRPVQALCAELGPRLLALAALPDAERCALGSGAGPPHAYIGVFLRPSAAVAEALGGAGSDGPRPARQAHVTLAHRESCPWGLAAALHSGLLGAPCSVRVSHRYTAAWEAGAAGAGAEVEGWVVAGLRRVAAAVGGGAGQGGGEEDLDLLPRVASLAPHVTLRVRGAASSAGAGVALRLLLAHVGGAAALPQAAAEVVVQGVRFTVAPEALELEGVVATHCGSQAAGSGSACAAGGAASEGAQQRGEGGGAQ